MTADSNTCARPPHRRIITRQRALIAATVLLTYVASYVIWSRLAMRHAADANAVGFYYFFPENTPQWEQRNAAAVMFYRPLGAIDRWLGFDGPCEHAPLWSASGIAAPPADQSPAPPTSTEERSSD